MQYLKLIPYLIMIILLSIIVYLQYAFHKDISDVNKKLSESEKSFSDYVHDQKELQLEMTVAITESNNKKFGELYEKLEDINNAASINATNISKLRETTSETISNYNSLSDGTKERYNKTISELFIESTELLREFAGAADRSTEAAITYHDIIVEQNRIVNEVNK